MLPHSPGPPASAPVECSACLLFLMYSSVVGIIFTCDSIRYSVYITHICYCTIIVQCPHTCATPSRFLPFTLLLASGKMIGSCTLPIVSVSVYILRTLTNTARPFHKTFLSICYCSLSLHLSLHPWRQATGALSGFSLTRQARCSRSNCRL